MANITPIWLFSSCGGGISGRSGVVYGCDFYVYPTEWQHGGTRILFSEIRFHNRSSILILKFEQNLADRHKIVNNLMEMERQWREKSVTKELLKALVPYSRQQFTLAFKPNKFFNDLEKITNAKRATIASTYSRAKRSGYIVMKNGVPVLTSVGRAKIGQIEKPDLLSGWLVVSFDIPERRRADRYELRSYLKSRGFKQVQKSLWCSRYDYAEDIREFIAELRLGQHVIVFVAAAVFAPSGLS